MENKGALKNVVTRLNNECCNARRCEYNFLRTSEDVCDSGATTCLSLTYNCVEEGKAMYKVYCLLKKNCSVLKS